MSTVGQNQGQGQGQSQGQRVAEDTFKWTVVKVFQNEFDESGQAQAVQIRKGVSDTGFVVFSFAVGVIVGNNEDLEWRMFKYIPGKYISEYVRLLNHSAGWTLNVTRRARSNGNGSLSEDLFDSAIADYQPYYEVV